MRFRIKVSAILLAAACIVFVSCNKHKPKPPVPPPSQTKKISRVEENNRTILAFEYNTDGTLKKVSTNYGASTTFHFTFTYDAQKRPTELVSNQGFKAKYIYINNVLDRTENYEDGEKVSENIFTYENGKLKTNTLFTAFPKDNGDVLYLPTYRVAFIYHANGNVRKAQYYTLNATNNELGFTHEYVYDQYDDKKNPMSVITDFTQVILYQPLNINNPLVEKLLSANGVLQESTRTEYTYDNAGYPVTSRITITEPNQPDVVVNVKYFY